MIVKDPIEETVKSYSDDYRAYFEANKSDGMTCLEPAPRWAIWPRQGTVAFGANYREASIIGDIAFHTAKVVQQAEGLGGWKALDEKEIFDVEYWELEQAKLKNKKAAPPLQGKVALVTGAASGIGLQCAKQLNADGAAVVALDVNPEVTTIFDQNDLRGIVCDVTNIDSVQENVEQCVALFGGLDIVVSNAGVFSKSSNIEFMDSETWERSLQLNLSQHKNLMQHSFPFLKLGLDPTFIVIGTRNVAAPGTGAAAYSCAKAALNQLCRVAALEMGVDGVRINTVHPDCVYDTDLWSGGVLEKRAENYGMTIEEYMSRNILKTPVTSVEVGKLVATMAGTTFAKTTGAQIPIDGGNERVI